MTIKIMGNVKSDILGSLQAFQIYVKRLQSQFSRTELVIVSLIYVILIFISKFALVVSMEIIALIACLAVKNVRSAIAQFVRSRSSLPWLFFILSLCISSFYGEATLLEKFEEVWSWRKLIYVIFGFVVVTKVKDIDSVAFLFLIMAIFYLCGSYLVKFCEINASIECGFIFSIFGNGASRVFENESTQGVIFVLGISSCFFFWLQSEHHFKNKIFQSTLFLASIFPA